MRGSTDPIGAYPEASPQVAVLPACIIFHNPQNLFTATTGRKVTEEGRRLRRRLNVVQKDTHERGPHRVPLQLCIST
jgi:hypothetical protein